MYVPLGRGVLTIAARLSGAPPPRAQRASLDDGTGHRVA